MSEPSEDVDEQPCPLCQNVPCLLQQGLYDSMTDFEASLRDGDHDGSLTNKQVRFQLYRNAVCGILGSGEQTRTESCITKDSRFHGSVTE
jgi:hypothetical protein